ncbi:hypothetical protein QCA50_004016 [Cerrena zonata]|uniref:Uncharacterized protein n=1 Tax=Cerrena zonata TaxID=2478898 RepID=A0AAW0GG45_9APHY
MCELWMDSEAIGPIAIPSQYSLKLDTNQRLLLSSITSSDTMGEDIELLMLKIVLQYTQRFTEIHVMNYEVKGVVTHMRRVPEGGSPPSPDIFLEVGLPLTPRSHIQAILRLMRCPRMCDGNEDRLFERYIKVAIHLLFPEEDVYLVENSDDELKKLRLSNKQPLVLTAGMSNFTNRIRQRIAIIAEEVLIRLCSQIPKDNLPGKHWNHPIVYALHWDRYRLRIIAHFIINHDQDSPQCYQAVVAQHCITLPEWEAPELMPHREDDMPLDRWRIVASLLYIVKYIDNLKNLLKERSLDIIVPTNATVSSVTSSVLMDYTPTQSSYMAHLRMFWCAEQICIPQDWVISDDALYLGNGKTSVTRHMLPSLAKLLIYHIRESFKGLDTATIKTHSQSDDHIGPDFCHATYAPRQRFKPRPDAVDRHPSEQHLEKVYDILTLATTDFRDINLFLANTFSGFQGLSVDWLPRNTVSQPSDRRFMAVDFAVRHTVQNHDAQTLRVQAKENTVTESPITVLFGLRLRALMDHSIRFTTDEYDEIKRVVEPDLQRIWTRLRLHKETDEGLLDHAALFCTVLKYGHVFILAARLVPTGNDGKLIVDLQVVENGLPIAMTLGDTTDLLRRMRLCIALFTLKRHATQLGRRLHQSNSETEE